MKLNIITLTFLLIFGNLFSQNKYDIKGKWYLKKIELNDSIVDSNDRYFIFYENTFELNKKMSRIISQGNYTVNNSISITFYSNKDKFLNGSFILKIENNESINLKNDSLSLYLTRYYTPSDFVQNVVDSKEDNLKGWEAFKNKKFSESLNFFNKAYLKDSTNYDAIIGLVYSKSAVEGKIDMNLINIIIKNTTHTHWEIGITASAFLNQYFYKDNNLKDEDLNPEMIAAYFASGPFIVKYENGKTKFSGEFQNKKESGKWIYYRRDTSIEKTVEFIENTNLKIYSFYKDNNEIAKKEEYVVAENVEELVKRYIFYQELPDKKGEYLFVSKTGFCVFDKDKNIQLDSTTPDNIIEEIPNLQKENVWYIWKDGKRIIYKL